MYEKWPEDLYPQGKNDKFIFDKHSKGAKLLFFPCSEEMYRYDQFFTYMDIFYIP